MTTPPTHNLRVLWASDAPWATSGYSVETALTATRLKEHCHLALLCTFGLHGGVQEWNGIPVFPGGADAFANDVIPKAARAWKADIVITLKDALVFNPQTFAGLRWAPMVPIDHDPPTPQVTERVRQSYRPIAYAPHGFKALRRSGLDPLYAPHAYDPAIFSPLDKAEARKTLNLSPDLFIIGTCAVNRGGIPSRKSWVENLEAFAMFARDKPHARYFVHTDLADEGYEGGIPLRPLMASMGILDKVLYCDQERYRYGGFPPEYMRAYYNSLDVLNAVSNGEGFGIPVLEAQAVGTPVIVGDWCAHEDLCWGGWKVDKREAHHFYDQQQGWVFIAQPPAIADRMQQAHTAMRQTYMAAEKRKQALAGAEPYQIDTVIADHWLPLLAEIEQDISIPRSRGVLRIIRREEVFS
jgi:glycosyltransferase involved in cell wall biosynthesis